MTYEEYHQKYKHLLGERPFCSNRCPNPRQLIKLQSAILERMQEMGDDAVFLEKQELYVEADVSQSGFRRNFEDFNSVMYWSKFYVLTSAGEAADKKADCGVTELCYAIIGGLTSDDRQRELTRFALRRFNNRYWMEVFAPIKSKILKDSNIDEPTSTALFAGFTAMFVERLKIIVDKDIKYSDIVNCVRFLVKCIDRITAF